MNFCWCINKDGKSFLCAKWPFVAVEISNSQGWTHFHYHKMLLRTIYIFCRLLLPCNLWRFFCIDSKALDVPSSDRPLKAISLRYRTSLRDGGPLLVIHIKVGVFEFNTARHLQASAIVGCFPDRRCIILRDKNTLLNWSVVVIT